MGPLHDAFSHTQQTVTLQGAARQRVGRQWEGCLRVADYPTNRGEEDGNDGGLLQGEDVSLLCVMDVCCWV